MTHNFFEWSEEFNTGNQQIDGEHFKLVELINQLLSLSVNNTIIELDSIIKIGEQLSIYVDLHFSTEEVLMDTIAIDTRHSKEHLKYHQNFVKEINQQFANPLNLQEINHFNTVVEYLIRWLAYHILSTDKSLTRQISYIQNDGISPEKAYEKDNELLDSTTEPFIKALRILYQLVVNKNQELENKVQIRTSELSKANKHLSHLLFHDVLTGLHNRRYVMDELEKQIQVWNRYKVPFSILYMDIDKFKSINDNYGHEHGDQVLIWIARFIESNVRETDIACRLGGDEFVIICPHTTIDGAYQLGQKLNQLFITDCDNEFEFWTPSISIGVSSYNDNVKNSSELLNKADSAMYQAKVDGGGKTSVIE